MGKVDFFSIDPVFKSTRPLLIRLLKMENCPLNRSKPVLSPFRASRIAVESSKVGNRPYSGACIRRWLSKSSAVLLTQLHQTVSHRRDLSSSSTAPKVWYPVSTSRGTSKKTVPTRKALVRDFRCPLVCLSDPKSEHLVGKAPPAHFKNSDSL